MFKILHSSIWMFSTFKEIAQLLKSQEVACSWDIYSLAAKELSLCHKFWYSSPYIFATKCSRPVIFQTINSVRSNSLGLKYKSFTPSGCKDKGIINIEFVAKTQILFRSLILNY